MRTLCTFLLCATAALSMTVTPGKPMSGVTASTVLGSDHITITAQSAGNQIFETGQVLKIGTNSGLVIVTGLVQVGNPATTSTILTVVADDWTTYSAPATASSLAVVLYADYLEHSQVRIWFRTDLGACAAVWYDIASRDNSTTPYQYRSNETSSDKGNNCTATEHAVDAIGIAPNTRWHFRANAKGTYGNDNTGACKTDACGAEDFALTTPPDTHAADGRPPMPTLPDPVPASLRTVDTTGYTTVHIPKFAPTTGSVADGSATLTLDSVPSGIAANQWIYIVGGKCPASVSPAPWCKISTIVGSTVTLDHVWVSDTGAAASHAAVTYSLFDIMERIRSHELGYGTIIESDQSVVYPWWNTDLGYSPGGPYMLGLPADDNASCSTHPCSIDDPAHRWIIFRAASTPLALPPAGVRTGPEYRNALPCIESHDTSGAFLFLGGASSMPSHHYRIENWCSVPLTTASNAADPPIRGGEIQMRWGSDQGKYIAFDRYLHIPPNNWTRNAGNVISGENIAITNSYIVVAAWRPWLFTYTGSVTQSVQSISFGGVSWQRNSHEALVTQGAATITASGTASGTVDVWGVMETAAGNGMEIRYTSGRGVTITCGACRAVNALADPTPTDSQKAVLQTSIASSGTDFGSLYLKNDANFQEGLKAVQGIYGNHWLVENNRLTGINMGFFVDVPEGGGLKMRGPADLTYRRNSFYWPQSYRATSAETDGFVYAVRHNGIEFKRGIKILIEGNEFFGGWANVNNGPALLISETAYDDPVVGRVEDYTARYNLFHTQSEAFSVNPHYVYTYAHMGANVSRVYFGHNLSYDQNAWQQVHGGQYFIGKVLLPCATDIIIEHNTIYDARSNLPIWQGCGEDRAEGGWFVDNVWMGNRSAYGWLQMQREGTGLAPIPDTSYASDSTGATYDDAYASTFLRVNGSTATGAYSFKNNLIVCGSQQNAVDAGDGKHTLASEVDFTASQCNTYKSRFGALATTNYFVISPDSKATRFAAVKWANPAPGTNDFRYQYDSDQLKAVTSTDGRPMGADVYELDRQRGVISNLNVQNKREAGSGGCSGTAGTHCVTLVATVPDKGTTCQAAYGTHAPDDQTGWTPTAPDTATTEARSFTVTGLAAGTHYWRMNCAGMPPVDAVSFTLP